MGIERMWDHSLRPAVSPHHGSLGENPTYGPTVLPELKARPAAGSDPVLARVASDQIMPAAQLRAAPPQSTESASGKNVDEQKA